MREVTAPVLSPPQLLTLAAHHPLTQPPCLTEHRLRSVDYAIPENVRAQTSVRLPSMSMGSVCVCPVLVGAQDPRCVLVCCFGLF